eukprot:Lithocolla_globosa_v1_NODE_2320_length_2050_cov_3.305764.p1 type:complete len:451 gc:universal NODE_2320_length_2050_cov_3.305764:1464-112(-)
MFLLFLLKTGLSLLTVGEFTFQNADFRYMDYTYQLNGSMHWLHFDDDCDLPISELLFTQSPNMTLVDWKTSQEKGCTSYAQVVSQITDLTTTEDLVPPAAIAFISPFDIPGGDKDPYGLSSSQVFEETSSFLTLISNEDGKVLSELYDTTSFQAVLTEEPSQWTLLFSSSSWLWWRYSFMSIVGLCCCFGVVELIYRFYWFSLSRSKTSFLKRNMFRICFDLEFLLYCVFTLVTYSLDPWGSTGVLSFTLRRALFWVPWIGMLFFFCFGSFHAFSLLMFRRPSLLRVFTIWYCFIFFLGFVTAVFRVLLTVIVDPFFVQFAFFLYIFTFLNIFLPTCILLFYMFHYLNDAYSTISGRSDARVKLALNRVMFLSIAVCFVILTSLLVFALTVFDNNSLAFFWCLTIMNDGILLFLQLFLFGQMVAMEAYSRMIRKDNKSKNDESFSRSVEV